MISLDLTKSSEVRKAGDRPNTIPTYKLLLLFKRKSQKRVKKIFWHPCDDSAAIMFNEGHDLIFVEKKKTSLAQKIYI